MSAEKNLSVEPDYCTEWPENGMTALLSPPEEGNIAYVRDGSDEGWYQIVWQNISMEASAEYTEALLGQGYETLCADENGASAGTILQRDEVTLSVAYTADELNILILISSTSCEE